MAKNKNTTSEEITLWLIEDNAAFRSNMTEMLNSSEKMHCRRDFSSCEEAIERLESVQVAPQVVLMDLSIPGMRGIEGIKKMREINSEIKFIVLTGSDKPPDVFNAICEGASGYLLKNTSVENVIHGIQDVMEGGASLDPHVALMVLNAVPRSDVSANEHDLTVREVEVLEHLAEGKSIKEISDMIHLSLHTIKFHVANTYKKLNVQSQAGAVAKGIRRGII